MREYRKFYIYLIRFNIMLLIHGAFANDHFAKRNIEEVVHDHVYCE